MIAGSLVAARCSASPAPAFAAEEQSTQPQPPRQKWSFAGPFGKYDRGAVAARLQGLSGGLRGLPRPQRCCRSAISPSRAVRASPTAQVEAIAAEYKVQDGPNDQGEMFERAGPAGRPLPAAVPRTSRPRARANSGAVPPDMSVLAKARSYERGFPWFIFDMLHPVSRSMASTTSRALLTGYEEAAGRLHAAAGLVLQRLLPRPRHRACRRRCPTGRSTTPTARRTTVDQYSKDVAAFLMWAAEPHLEARKRIGFQVMIFLLVLSGLLYFTKKKVWAARALSDAVSTTLTSGPHGFSQEPMRRPSHLTR